MDNGMSTCSSPPDREQSADYKQSPDYKQRDLVTRELDRCILVEAAAGTGKTASIVDRMLTLLRSGKCGSIGNMAAVTFTRKAAAELRSRFQVALEKAVREAAGEEKDNLEKALLHVEQCFIGTIHSFCARLLRERPVEAGVDLAFEEIDEEADRRLRSEAWDAFAAGLIADDPEGILEELGRLGLMLSDLRSAFESFADFPDVDEWPRPETGVKPEFERARRELDRYLAHMTELAPRLVFDYGTDSLVPKLLRLPRIASHYDGLERPDQLMEVLEHFGGKAEPRVTFWEKRGGFTRDEAREEKECWDRFCEDVVKPALLAWYELRYTAVIDLMLAARDHYDSLRRERGQLNFQDLLMKAAALLRENPTVRRYFQSRFTHLLVDEFQDTDPIQAEVILLLTSSDPDEADWRACAPRPGSLFIVGDPKQSIYRFRRADIVTYNEVKAIILEGGGGLAVNLAANFRAVPPIITWLNGVFEPGEPECDALGKVLLRFPACEGEESPSYVSLLEGREGGSAGELCGVYTLHIPEDLTKLDRAVEYEADFIARTIRHALDTGMTVPRTRQQVEGGRSNAVDASDFMIVTRNTRYLSVYARALQGYGIPHQVTGGWALNELEELKLLYTCLRAVVYPDDPVALVAALRSELFGLSDTALYAYKKAGGSFSYNAGIPGDLPCESAEAFGDAFERLKTYSLWLSRLPCAAACERIAADLGLPALAAARPGGDVQAGSLGKALELLRGIQTEMWTAAQLVEHLAKLVEREERYDGVSALSGVLPAVRVMNLHKVKGLEAPVVFLADPSGESEHEVTKHIDRSGGRVLGYLPIYRGGTARGEGRLLAQPAGWESLVERERGFARAEALRLRYVAATRAGAAAIITQRGVRNEGNPWCYFEPHLAPEYSLPDPGPQVPPAGEKITLSSRDIEEAASSISSRLDAIMVPTYDARGVKEYARSSGADTEPVEVAVALPGGSITPSAPAGEHGVEWGEVIHLLLETGMAEPGADIERLAAAALAEAGLDASLAPDAAALARSVMDAKIWRRALDSEACLVEAPFQVMQDEGVTVPTVLRGVIDLVFRENGGWVLVDYKTDRLDGESAEETARLYAAQVRLYVEAWERCTGEPVKEAFLYFTSTGALVEIT